MLFLGDNFVMDTKIQQFFDGAISAAIIFVTAYFFMSLSDMDAMTAVAASLALAFAGGALWRRIVRTDKRCKNYDAYLSRFIYCSPRQNAEKLFAFFFAALRLFALRPVYRL